MQLVEEGGETDALKANLGGQESLLCSYGVDGWVVVSTLPLCVGGHIAMLHPNL
jgi:hypothetical protein